MFVDKNLIDVHVQFGTLDFFVTWVYGDPVPNATARVSERQTRIGIQRKESWCIIGDFNEIIHNDEKLGSPRRGDASFLPFKDMLNSCKMVELPSQGNGFTWGGMRHKLWIQSKLAQCFGNKEWYKMFLLSNHTFLDKRGSDHRPFLVRFASSKEV